MGKPVSQYYGAGGMISVEHDNMLNLKILRAAAVEMYRSKGDFIQKRL